MNTIRSLVSRCAARRGLPVALWAVPLMCGAAFAGDDRGTGSLTPEQTVRTYYESMGNRQCAEALRLRPEYPLERCQGFELVKLHNVEERSQTRGTAQVSLDMEYRMHGQAAREHGCAILKLVNNAWRYQDFKDADCPAIVAAGTSVAGDAAPAAVGRPARASSPAPMADNGAAEPIDALRRYYATSDSRGRPIALDAIQELMHNDEIGVAVIAYRIGNERDAADRSEPLESLAFMEKQRGKWQTPQIYDRSQAAEVNARYAQALAAGQPPAGSQQGQHGRNGAANSPAAPLDTTILTQAPPPREAPALDLPDAPVQGQSYPVLERCWSRRDLLGNAAEKHARRVHPPDVSGPSRALIARAESATGRRSGAAPGSIRWVDLDDPKGQALALTFDLCEQADEQSGYDAEIVDYLREKNVPATFFAGGKWLRSHRERAKQLMADPLFEVGNHAWTHGNLRVLKGREMREQILWTQAQYIGLRDELMAQCGTMLGPDLIERIPEVPATFRFPYGTCSNESLTELADDGLAAVQWNIVTGDPGRGQTAEAIAETVRKHVKPGRGAIVVMHANGRGFATAKALRTMIPQLQRQGYQFVTVSGLLRLGTPHAVAECYEQTPGDNTRYDALFGRGTGLELSR